LGSGSNAAIEDIHLFPQTRTSVLIAGKKLPADCYPRCDTRCGTPVIAIRAVYPD